MTKETKLPRVILQARTSSTRLPGKVLLPLGGMPLAVLCAKRLGRDGLDVIVATSTDSSDDSLVEALIAAGIHYYRGSLDDVLGRFVGATEDMEDDQIVVRATADNPVPDASFVRDLVEFLEEKDGVYATTSSPADGLPYGLSAEAMRAAALREAAHHATHMEDREHVTPWIRRTYRTEQLDRHRWGYTDSSALRCTIDSFDDYQRMYRVFSSLSEDPVSVPWSKVVAALSMDPESAAFRIPYRIVGNSSEGIFTLGTVQLGLDYGINNPVGQPSEADAIKIVRHGIDHGITWLDTARSYGDSEYRLGRALKGSWKSCAKVITKLPAAPDFNQSCSKELVQDWVDAQIFKSLYALDCRHLDVLMLHRWADRDAQNGALWSRLLEQRDGGLVRSLGASLYHPDQAIRALSDPAIKHIQIPFNILDRRWLEPEIQQSFQSRPDVCIQIRSVFLQGLLLSDGERWPKCDSESTLYLRLIDELVEELNRSSRTDLFIAYTRAHPWVTSIVLGVETLEQLEANLKSFSISNPLTPNEIDVVHARLPGAPECVLDPSQWSL